MNAVSREAVRYSYSLGLRRRDRWVLYRRRLRLLLTQRREPLRAGGSVPDRAAGGARRSGRKHRAHGAATHLRAVRALRPAEKQ